MSKTIRLILGDQLNEQHSWFTNVDDNIIYTLMEIKPESEYVTHHIQKIVGIFLGMRTFAAALISKGHNVEYYKINAIDNLHSFSKNINQLLSKYDISKIEYQAPDEYRLDQLLSKEFNALDLAVEMYSTEHFYTSRFQLRNMFEGKKQYLMENFYRKMRKEHNVLIDDDQPVTGKWNYDHENRKKLPKGHQPPLPIAYAHNVKDIVDDISAIGLQSIGTIDELAFIWPKNRAEALEVLSFFIENLLGNFGTYQDALSNEYWSVYHSRLSFALNTKMISPKEVVSAVEQAWRIEENINTIANVEGFIRQILGWREYMRGIYWAHMPGYRQENFFNHTAKLPEWYWTGDTKMNCLSRAIKQSLQYSYAHHIQRLMVTGNFALLAGVNPDEIDQWYLGIYIDAFEWVEITNTRGMSQYADGGIVGTKPYISSGAYIHKMGNQCSSCHYKYKVKTGDRACPFNSLYWNFLDKHRDKLATNPRMSMMYRIWDKMDSEKQTGLILQANSLLENMETL